MADSATGRRGFVRASWANVLGNAVKIIVEGAVGLAFGSMALLADAAHSIADLVASVVVLVWGRSSFDEPDDTHPHGHDRIEPLTALFVGSVIAVLGLNLLYESAHGLAYGIDVTFSPLLLGALAFAIADMYLVYRYTEYINADLGSTALDALATDCLNDIFTSFAAVVGVLGVLFGIPMLDPIAGGLVSILVIYQGISIGRENVDYLIGLHPSRRNDTKSPRRSVAIPLSRASTISRSSMMAPSSRSRSTSKSTAICRFGRPTISNPTSSISYGTSRTSVMHTSISTRRVSASGKTNGTTDGFTSTSARACAVRGVVLSMWSLMQTHRTLRVFYQNRLHSRPFGSPRHPHCSGNAVSTLEAV